MDTSIQNFQAGGSNMNSSGLFFLFSAPWSLSLCFPPPPKSL
jgi:hypothetical protein